MHEIEEMPGDRKLGQKIPGKALQLHYLQYICRPKTKGALSSAGSEHLVYTEGVGGSNPSAPTKEAIPVARKRGRDFLLLKGDVNLRSQAIQISSYLE